MSALRGLSTSLNSSTGKGRTAATGAGEVSGAGDMCPCMAAAAEESSRRFHGFSFVSPELITSPPALAPSACSAPR